MTKDENKSNPKNSSDREPDEVLDLLQNFYQPESTEIEEFTEFYAAIEKKLNEQNPVSRIAKLGNDLENSLNEREQKLSQYIRRLEQKRIKPQNTNKNKNTKKIEEKKPQSFFSTKLVASIVVLALVALASIASLKNMQSYNYISLEGDDIDWKILNLNEDQQTKLQAINQSWQAFQAKESSIIEERKSKLVTEMNKEKPDFSLMDKYQRDILDHEVAIKREKLNTFLEKRFILNEEQSLKLIREMNKKAKVK